MTIGRLAALVEVNVETVRYYQRRGLLPEPTRGHGQARRYGDPELQSLRFIRRAQAMGFTLREIDRLLDMRKLPACPATRALAAARLEAIERRMAELAAFRAELRQWIAACDGNPSNDCCPGLDRLGEDDASPKP